MSQLGRPGAATILVAGALIGLAILAVWGLWSAGAVLPDRQAPATAGLPDATVDADTASPAANGLFSQRITPQPLRPAGGSTVDASGLLVPPARLPPLPAIAEPNAVAVLPQVAVQAPAIPDDSVIQTQGWVSASDSRIAQQMVWQRIFGCVQTSQRLRVQFGVAGGRGSSELYQPQWQGPGGPAVASCLTQALQGLRLPVATDTQGTLTLQFGPMAANSPDWQPL